jgi:hypothetical protein
MAQAYTIGRRETCSIRFFRIVSQPMMAAAPGLIGRTRGSGHCERGDMKLNLIILSLAGAVLLAGCGIHLLPAPEDQSRLALACETTRCDCEPPKEIMAFSTPPSEPVQWRPEGTAFCREGLLLTRLP